MTVQKAGVAAALPFLLNPATVGVVAIGAVGWGLYTLLRDEGDEEDSENAGMGIANPNKISPAPKINTVEAKPEELQVSSQPAEPAESCLDAAGHSEAFEGANAVDQKEIVRQAMSELGKRSAAARARRKAAASEGVMFSGE